MLQRSQTLFLLGVFVLSLFLLTGPITRFTLEGSEFILKHSGLFNEAGEKLAALAQGYDFSMFEYWASDYAGHKQNMDWAIEQLETFDGVLDGLVKSWNLDKDLILITSDHGNMEDLSTRRHTDAKVPGLVIGVRVCESVVGTFLRSIPAISRTACRKR